MDYQKFIEDNKIIEKLVDYHYDIEREYLKTDDVVDGTLEEKLAEMLWEDYGYSHNESEKYSKDIMALIRVDILSEIEARDKEAEENYKEFEIEKSIVEGRL